MRARARKKRAGHTHTHTRTQRERKREKGWNFISGVSSEMPPPSGARRDARYIFADAGGRARVRFETGSGFYSPARSRPPFFFSSFLFFFSFFFFLFSGPRARELGWRRFFPEQRRRRRARPGESLFIFAFHAVKWRHGGNERGVTARCGTGARGEGKKGARPRG